MAHPIVLQDATLRHFTQTIRAGFRLPQWKYLVIILLAFIECPETRTLSGLLRHIAARVSLSGLSRFLARSRWSLDTLTEARRQHFATRLTPLVQQAHATQRAQQPQQRGRPARTVVTGYVILDDSTHAKPSAQHMEGLGLHYSTSAHRPVPGHSLVQSVYVLDGQQLPLTPHLYRQQAVCQREGVPFQSKVELAVQEVQQFVPVADTHTHVLVDSWYTSRRLWRSVRQRGWDITAGLKHNRCLRVTADDGTRTELSVAEYLAALDDTDFTSVAWPTQQGTQVVAAHLVRAWVKKLGPCQVLITKAEADAVHWHARVWATSRCSDTLEQVVAAAAQRWAIEVLFADFKEVLGSDQYQVRSATALVRFWALGLCVYQYLDEQRVALSQQWQRSVSLGEARRWVQEQHAERLLTWLVAEARAGTSVEVLRDRLAAAA